MEVKLIEQKDDKVKLEVNDKTFVNLIHEKLWEQGKIEVSTWSQDHPYLTKPMLLVKAKDPKKVLVDAAEEIASDAQKLLKQFEKAVK